MEDVRRIFLAMLLSPVLVGSGCAPEGRNVNRYVLGDTTVVESSRPLVRDTLEPIEVARFGRSDGPLEYIFSDVYTFAVGRDGGVFVHDANDGIRHFGSDGTYIGRVAGSGEGPSEVRYVLGMDVDGAGRLAAIDLGNGRISIFDLPGKGVATVRRPNVLPRYGDGSIRFHADGSLWIGMHPQSPESGVITHPRPAYLRIDADGSVGDTVFTPRHAGTLCTTLSERRYRAGFWEDRREPFVPKATWAFGPNGSFAIGCPKQYVIDVYGAEGGVTRIRRAWTPLLMSEDEREGLTEQAGITNLPRARPAFARLILPGDGRVWVWPNQPSDPIELPEEVAARFGRTHAWRIGSHGAFDVFQPDGEWLATVRLPAEVRFSGFPTERGVLIRGDTIWALAHDDMDVQTIVRYEVQGLAGGLH